MDEPSRDIPEEGPAGARDEGKARRPIFQRGHRRLAAVYALAAISFAFGAGMGALYGVSRRRQGRLIGRLESDLALAERTRASLEEALAREKELRSELEAARRRHGVVGTTTLSPPRGEVGAPPPAAKHDALPARGGLSPPRGEVGAPPPAAKHDALPARGGLSPPRGEVGAPPPAAKHDALPARGGLSPPRGETVPVVRRGGEEERQMYARSERERREMSRIAEEKSDELIHRHNRIVELQRQVERLVRERSETKDAVDSRRRELCRAYEAEVRKERRRRKDLEEKLAVLDEIEDLHRQLARLADRMQELVREEERRDAEGR